MSDGQIPTSIGSGTINLFGVSVRVHVLDNGQRVIEQESVVQLLEAMATYKGEIDEDELNQFARWCKGLS